jgi:hypothetical protein
MTRLKVAVKARSASRPCAKVALGAKHFILTSTIYRDTIHTLSSQRALPTLQNFVPWAPVISN